MKYQVSDLVYMPGDKYEGDVYGIIISYREEKQLYEVAWLDDYPAPTLEKGSNIYLVSEKHNNEK